MPSTPAEGAAAHTVPESIRWQDGTLALLDQRALPDVQAWVHIDGIDAACSAIRDMVVRGAPAIGIAAAHALALAGVALAGADAAAQQAWLRGAADALAAARPTAVNLAWAVRRVQRAGQAAGAGDFAAALRREADAIHAEDRAICRGIGAAGLPLITAGAGVLTHCNAGALAVSELGTATAPMYLAHRAGIAFRVYADETRPVLQGARLTAWELQQAGIDVTLVCDNMAAHLMSRGLIDLVLVGTDRVTANGDVVNKIGTLGVAVLAKHFGVPFYVACPSSTWDPDTARGADVVIEERRPDEVTEVRGVRIAAPGVKVANPAFDVTPAALVTGIVTERGIVRPSAGVDLGEALARQLGPAREARR